MTKGINTMIFLLILLQVFLFVICAENRIALSTDELQARYGQENVIFGDEKSCDRECDGRSKICYYKFKAEHYNTMGARCDDCDKNVTKDCFNPGCIVGNGMERNVLTMNRQIPGPTISVCLHDDVIIDVENHMGGSELAIHWHGLHQRETPWMDGVPMVTQCPIASGNKFQYRFNVSEAGTHYWHAHTGFQRTDGLFGRFVVRNPKALEPNGNLYDFDENQHALILSDWMNVMATEFAPGTHQKALKVDSVLINGIGCYTDEQQTNCDNIPVSTFYMQRGKAYRWRMDSTASNNCPLELTFEGLNMTVIATDGFAVEPITFDALIILSGERYDVVVYAQNDSPNESKIRLRGLGNCGKRNIQTFGRIIYYDDPTNFERQISDAAPILDRLDYEMPFTENAISLNHPISMHENGQNICVGDLQQKQVGLPAGGNLREVQPDRVIPLTFSLILADYEPSNFLAVGKKALIGRINKISSTTPSVAGLISNDSSVSYCDVENLPPPNEDIDTYFCTHLISIKRNAVVDFEIHDGGHSGFVSHPFHLHGHGFQVIDIGTKQQYETNTTPYANSTRLPVVKDTIAVPSGGFAIIRFVASNPGYWFFHCHFEWHMDVGMRAIIRIGEKSDMKTPPEDFPTCRDYLPPVYAE